MSFMQHQADYVEHGLPHPLTLGANGERLALASNTPNSRLYVPAIRDPERIFDVSGFNEFRPPHPIGFVDLDVVPNDVNIKSMPIKFPGSDIRMPDELEYMRPFLELTIAAEASISPEGFDKRYLYVTVTSTYVDKGSKQSASGGKHVDGMQGPRYIEKKPIDRTYLAVNNTPTRFYPSAIDVKGHGYDTDTHFMDDVFDELIQADAPAFTFPSGTVVLFDALIPHEAMPAEVSGWRKQLKLASSTHQYDRFGNTVNTLFVREYEDQEWVFQARAIEPSLRRSRKFGGSAVNLSMHPSLSQLNMTVDQFTQAPK